MSPGTGDVIVQSDGSHFDYDADCAAGTRSGLWQNRQRNSTDQNRQTWSNSHAARVRLFLFQRIRARHLTNGKQQSRRYCLGGLL
jgi:IS5 family transposase